MALFRASTDDALKAARGALAGTETKIAELIAERESKLHQDVPIGDIARIDTALTTHRHNALILEERIAGLLRRQHEEHRAELEQLKRAAIAREEKKLGRCLAAAKRLLTGLNEVKSAYAELMAAFSDIFVGWPEAVRPRRDIGYLRPKLPARIAGPLQAIIAGRGDDIEDFVRKISALIVETLNETPIPEPEAETERSAA
jgi:hypothetical protein